MSKPLIQSTGRRKEAVARVRLRPGTGVITVNRRPIERYFPSQTYRMVATEALRVTQMEEVYDVDATLVGGSRDGAHQRVPVMSWVMPPLSSRCSTVRNPAVWIAATSSVDGGR